MGFFPTILEAFPRLEIFKPEIFQKKIGGKKTMGSMTEPWELDEKSLKP